MTWAESSPVYFQVTTAEGDPLTVSMSALHGNAWHTEPGRSPQSPQRIPNPHREAI